MKHTHISAKHKLLDLKLNEVWQYRDLIGLFVHRSITVSYKQTILGPLWLFISPLMTSVVYVVLFGNIARLSTDGVPQILFYLMGNALWSFFSGCVGGNASTFTGNAGLFGKVYFPRMAVPVASVLGKMVRFGIQMLLVLGFEIFYLVQGRIAPNWWLWPLLPLALVVLGVLGMGIGIILSSMTTKYRDLSVLVGFGLQLWMYASPVVYPLSAVDGWLHTVLLWNPVSMPLELFRMALFGTGSLTVWSCVWSLGLALGAALFGIIVFNKVERTFMDTV